MVKIRNLDHAPPNLHAEVGRSLRSGRAMTLLTIELPDDQKAMLAAKAQAKGLSAEQYAREVLEHDLVPEWLGKSWETSKAAGLDHLSTEEIDAEIADARKAQR